MAQRIIEPGLSRRRLNIDWCLKFKPAGKKTRRVGLTVDTLGPDDCPYMFRIVLWLEPFFTLRLHRFYRSDNDRHLHDHPWWFFTFPLATYREWVPAVEDSTKRVLLEVKRWRLHYRPAAYRHAVVVEKPCWTFVITGTRFREWGFWMSKGFKQWYSYFTEYGVPPCASPEDVKRS